MSGFVLDCSVTMSWCFEDEADDYSPAILQKLDESVAVVPWIWTLEVANALLTAERRGRMREAETLRFLSVLQGLEIMVDAECPGEVMDEVIALGRCHGLTAYDAAYLELAMRNGFSLATLDDKLKAAARAVGVSIVDR